MAHADTDLVSVEVLGFTLRTTREEAAALRARVHELEAHSSYVRGLLDRIDAYERSYQRIEQELSSIQTAVHAASGVLRSGR